MCDLNAPHFVRERRDRAELLTLMTARAAIIRNLETALEVVNLVRLLADITGRMIPPIALRSEQVGSVT
jgi:hypothetical protein